ncbi:hypothetical protein [Riemerella anatipestifer]|uniref:hypothetical protein n=1 Tax=Riemerella anatipestifer TaxID=34085 RepID=UPI001375268D|nr:hypothetical protein [Riemerella anatipestifer]
MKIIVHTTKAKTLYGAINSKIEEELKTWEIVNISGNEIVYTHTPEQWRGKALVYPLAHKDGLELEITWWKDCEPDEATKGYILGRFTEILMVHFRNLFDYLEIRG